MSQPNPDLFKITQADVERTQARAQQLKREAFELRDQITTLRQRMQQFGVNEQGESAIPKRFIESLEDANNWLVASYGASNSTDWR
jgi:predicted RNase H-like nuclease (RuvC/YqgF family)